MKIILFILFIISLLFLYFKQGMKPYQFRDMYIDKIYIFLCILLYRGELTVFNSNHSNGIVFILFKDEHKKIFFEKYKEKDKTGMVCGIPIYLDKNDWDKKILDEVKEKKLEYYFDEKPESFKQKDVEKVLYIDIKQDINLGQELVKIISQDILKLHNNTYDIYFENINPIPDKIIGFDKTPDFIKMGVDITLPTIKMIMRVRQRKIFFHELKKWFKG